MAQTTLITGASSGIGKGFAYEFAKRGCNLLLVARSTDKLEILKQDLEQRYPISVKIFAADLSEEHAASKLVAAIQAQNLTVDCLVNNAGFSTKGLFSHTDFTEQHQEMLLNMVTLTELSYLFSQAWEGTTSKTIINIASAASFQPTPYSAVYSATKAYVLSLTEALNFEYKDKGIYYLAVCPGATATHFFDKIGDFVSKKRTVEDVITTTFKALGRRKVIAKDGFLTKVRSEMIRLLPRQTVTRIMGNVFVKYWGEKK